MPSWTEADWEKPGYVNGKIDHISLFDFSRPHMRAFHFAWFAFFSCFIMWFSIPPLMVTIKKPKCLAADSPTCVQCMKDFPIAKEMAADKVCKVCEPYDDRKGKGCGGLGLVKKQIVTSNVVSVAGTIIVRILIGSIADGLGVRTTYAVLLIFFSIPGFLAAAVTSYEAFVAARFFIGCAGGSFVLTQLWTSIMFHSNVVGLANATSAGWGNLGGGVALLITGAIFDSFKAQGNTNDKSWRYTISWPPTLLFVMGCVLYFFGDDCPYGNYSEMRKRAAQNAAADAANEEEILKSGGEPTKIAGRSLAKAAGNWKTWVLFGLYAWSFGIELVVNGNIALYFSEAYSLSQRDGGIAGSCFGLLNIFARSFGGYCSDWFNSRWGVRGRLWLLFIVTLLMGMCMVIFTSVTKDNGGFGAAMACYFIWGLWLQMTEGAVFAIVPFVEPTAVGGVAGIVGAGGNSGALAGNFILGIGKRPGLAILGWLSVCSAFWIPMLWMPGVGSMFRGDDSAPPPAPEKPKEAAAQQQPPMPGYGPPGAYPVMYAPYPGQPMMSPSAGPMPPMMSGPMPPMASMPPQMYPGTMGAPVMYAPPM